MLSRVGRSGLLLKRWIGRFFREGVADVVELDAFCEKFAASPGPRVLREILPNDLYSASLSHLDLPPQ